MTPIAPGQAGPPFTADPISRTDIVRYAGAAGDFNPIHHDEPFAHSAGLPSVMAHGMLSAGLLASFVTRWFGADSVRRYKVRFKDRVWPGDTLSAKGEIVAVFEKAGERRASLMLALLRQNGSEVVTGSAEVSLGKL